MGLNNPKFETYRGTNMSSPIEYSAIKNQNYFNNKNLARNIIQKKILKLIVVSPGGIKNNLPKKDS